MRDKPGFIGLLGTLCGDAGVNIANFQLGRTGRAASHRAARARRAVPGEVLAQLRAHKSIASARPLRFDVNEI